MDIVDKIRKIEALIAGAKSYGERQAAEFANNAFRKKSLLNQLSTKLNCIAAGRKSFLSPFAANMDFERTVICDKNIRQQFHKTNMLDFAKFFKF